MENMHSPKSSVKVIFALLLIIAVLSASVNLRSIQSETSGYEHTQKQSKLKIYSYNESNSYIEVFERLNKSAILPQTPTISVYPREYYYDICNANLKSDDSPDLMMIEHPIIIGQYISTNDLVDLQSHMQSSWKSKLDLFKLDNSQYVSPPMGIDEYVIFYNKELLDKLYCDASSMSFSALISICSKAKSAGVEPIAIGSRSSTSIRNILIQLCCELSPDKQLPNALEKFDSLKPFFSTQSRLMDHDDARMQFLNGKACFYFGMKSEMQFVSEHSDIDFAITHLKESERQFIWYDYVGMYAINRSSKNKIAAMEILKQLLNYQNTHIEYNITPKINDGTICIVPNWFYNCSQNDFSKRQSLLTELQW